MLLQLNPPIGLQREEQWDRERDGRGRFSGQPGLARMASATEGTLFKHYAQPSNLCAPASGPQLHWVTPSDSSELAVDKPQPTSKLDTLRCSEPMTSESGSCPAPSFPSDYTLTSHGAVEGRRGERDSGQLPKLVMQGRIHFQLGRQASALF